MPKVKVNDITMNCESQRAGEPLMEDLALWKDLWLADVGMAVRDLTCAHAAAPEGQGAEDRPQDVDKEVVRAADFGRARVSPCANWPEFSVTSASIAEGGPDGPAGARSRGVLGSPNCRRRHRR
jgi:hypothetical protein